MSIWRWFGQSPSSIGTFMTCAFQYRGKYLTKEAPWVETPQQAYGNRMHKAAEDHLVRRTPLPEEFASLQPLVDTVKGWTGKLFVEASLSVDKAWQPCDWKKRQIGNKIDVLNISDKPGYARILDWKTGKVRDDPLQLECNAVTVLINNPSIEHVRSAYVYTTAQEVKKHDFHREELELHRSRLGIKLTRMQNAFDTDKFHKQPSGLCRGWCNVKSCGFNSEYDGSDSQE